MAELDLESQPCILFISKTIVLVIIHPLIYLSINLIHPQMQKLFANSF